MIEHPILFSGPMVRAILEGRKTMTRRVVRAAKGTKLATIQEDGSTSVELVVQDLDREPIDRDPPRCKCGSPGDRLWIRETWASAYRDGCWGTLFSADGEFVRGKRQHEKGPHYNSDDLPPVKWRPSLFMPRWASRIELLVQSVHVERLQDITGSDILAEGAVERPHHDQILGRCPVSAFDHCVYPDLISLWAAGWDAINGKRAPWASNPLVWVVEFRVVAP